MMKLFAAVAATFMLAAFATTLTAECILYENSPALAEAIIAEKRIQIVSDVIDGRRPLLEAAAAFQDLDRNSPDLMVSYPGDTEGEKACQRVIAWVRARVETQAGATGAEEPTEASADPAAAVVARLQAELAAAKEKDAKLHLGGEAN
jgi:hypothetical protein